MSKLLQTLALLAVAMPATSAHSTPRAEGPSAPQDGRPESETEEYRIKADLLASFLKYSKFPEGTFAHKKSPIVVLVLGDDPFGPLLKATFAKKKIDGRSIQIRRLQRIPNRIEAHLVFAHGLKKSGQAKLITQLCGRPMLLVADTPGFAKAGGFINLYLDDGKIRFEINESCLKNSGVQLKADLLKLARIVAEPSETP